MSRLIVLVALCALSLGGICADNERTENAAGNKEEGTETDAKHAAPSDSTTGQEQDIYDKAGSCPHRFHMGCLLDAVEKSCTGLQVLESCANTGKCKNLEELGRIVDALNPSSFEAINKCCCSKAYKDGGYEDCKTPDQVCTKAVNDHINNKDLKENLELLKVCYKKKKQTDCKKALAAANWVREAVQKARGEMWPREGCQMLAPPDPLSKCGFDIKPEPRAIERADLYCDAIIWQFKEMGASDPFMAQCKDAPKMPLQPVGGDEQGEDGGEFDNDGGEDPEVIDEEEESEESESPDSDGAEQGMGEAEEESPEGDGEEEQIGDEDPEAEEPTYLKDEL